MCERIDVLQSKSYILFNDGHVLQLRSETVHWWIWFWMIKVGHMIPRDEFGINFRHSSYGWGKTPKKSETDPTGNQIRTCCMRDDGVTFRPQRWSVLFVFTWDNIVISLAAGPGLNSGRVNFLVEVFPGFSLNRKTKIRKFEPHSSPVIIWTSYIF